MATERGRILSTRMRPEDVVAAGAAARARGVSRSAWAGEILARAAREELGATGEDPEALVEAARADVERLEARQARLEKRIRAARARLQDVAGDGADEGGGS